MLLFFFLTSSPSLTSRPRVKWCRMCVGVRRRGLWSLSSSRLLPQFFSLFITEVHQIFGPSLFPSRLQVRQWCLIPTTPTSPPPFLSSSSPLSSHQLTPIRHRARSIVWLGRGDSLAHTQTHTDSDRGSEGDRSSLVWSVSMTPHPQPQRSVLHFSPPLPLLFLCASLM